MGVSKGVEFVPDMHQHVLIQNLWLFPKKAKMTAAQIQYDTLRW
jgi:hypothetical protein